MKEKLSGEVQKTHGLWHEGKVGKSAAFALA